MNKSQQVHPSLDLKSLQVRKIISFGKSQPNSVVPNLRADKSYWFILVKKCPHDKYVIIINYVFETSKAT